MVFFCAADTHVRTYLYLGLSHFTNMPKSGVAFDAGGGWVHFIGPSQVVHIYRSTMPYILKALNCPHIVEDDSFSLVPSSIMCGLQFSVTICRWPRPESGILYDIIYINQLLNFKTLETNVAPEHHAILLICEILYSWRYIYLYAIVF